MQLALEGLEDETLMKRLETRRGNGRNDYPVRVLWKLIIAMKVFEYWTVASFRRELGRNSQLRKICGLNDFGRKKHLVPHDRVFTKFIKLLSGEQEEIDRMFTETVVGLREEMASFGESLAGDGKFLDSYASTPSKKLNLKAGERAEKDAAWAGEEYYRTDKNSKEQVKTEWHYGFKAKLICDVKTELPLAYSVLEANSDEKKAMMEMLLNELRSRAAYLMLDKGYDC